MLGTLSGSHESAVPPTVLDANTLHPDPRCPDAWNGPLAAGSEVMTPSSVRSDTDQAIVKHSVHGFGLLTTSHRPSAAPSVVTSVPSALAAAFFEAIHFSSIGNMDIARWQEEIMRRTRSEQRIGAQGGTGSSSTASLSQQRSIASNDCQGYGIMASGGAAAAAPSSLTARGQDPGTLAARGMDVAARVELVAANHLYPSGSLTARHHVSKHPPPAVSESKQQQPPSDITSGTPTTRPPPLHRRPAHARVVPSGGLVSDPSSVHVTSASAHSFVPVPQAAPALTLLGDRPPQVAPLVIAAVQPPVSATIASGQRTRSMHRAAIAATASMHQKREKQDRQFELQRYQQLTGGAGETMPSQAVLPPPPPSPAGTPPAPRLICVELNPGPGPRAQHRSTWISLGLRSAGCVASVAVVYRVWQWVDTSLAVLNHEYPWVRAGATKSGYSFYWQQ